MKEFDLITKLLKPIAGLNAAGLGDDCAFLGGYSVTKDMLVEGIHFFAGDQPYNLARKALRVNLSDLASSGAEAFGFMLGLALPKLTSEAWLVEFASGLKSDIDKYKFQLLGGDTVFHDGPLMISITAIGKTPKPIIRGGAKLGDNIFVSGQIGGGLLGLKEKKLGLKTGKFITKYELPEPRMELGLNLRKIATSCIDISDGLLADLWHICEESNCGAEIYSEQISLADNSTNIIELLSGGDDYELLFTSSETEVKDCFRIGEIIAEKKLFLDGKIITPQGFQHQS